jgi:alkaline phosphatase
MGQAHRFAAQLLAAGLHGRLAMDRLPYVGQMATMSADPASFVTDSAAAATAIATGVKTLNGSVSIDHNGHERTTILELARDSGRSVGLVSTCQITDATPAAFAAHVPHRADQSEVARQYVEHTAVDVIMVPRYRRASRPAGQAMESGQMAISSRWRVSADTSS